MRLTLESQLPPLILAVTYMAGYRKHCSWGSKRQDPELTLAVIAPGSLFCSTLMAIQNKLYTVGLFYSLNARDTFATRNVTMDFTGNVSSSSSNPP